MKKIISFVLAAFIGLSAMAQTSGKGFELTVKIPGYPEDEELRLARYYGDKSYYADTAVFDKKRGVYVFKNPEPKEGGLYILVNQSDARLAEITIDKDQQFSMELKYPLTDEDIIFKNSSENQIFQDFNAKARPFYISMREAQRAFDSLADKTSPEAETLRKKMQTNWESMENTRTQFMADNPKHLMTAVFKAQKDIEVPEAPADLSDGEKQWWRYNYFKDNYFDNMDLSDDRLLRTPIFHDRLENYLEKVFSQQHPDTIKFAIERLAEKTRQSPELFKYVVWYTVQKYQQSQIVGYDAIWVYLAKKYYVGGDAYWATPSTIETFQKHVERYEPLLIGNIPTEFYCPDTNADRDNEQLISVFSPKTRYTIVMFWEPNCGHCKKQMPLLRDFYNRKHKELDFEVFAVCRDHSIDNWKKYIYNNNMTKWINVNGKASNVRYDDLWDVHSTPTVYVLDSQKRIVTKRVEVEQIEPFLKNWNALYYDGK